MDLLKAYVQQVVSYHPKASQEELFAEIYDELCEEYEDQKLSKSELSELEYLDSNKLHPMKYATQLAADSSSYLIGPQFYFSFISVLKIGIAITVLMFTVLAAITAIQSENIWRSFFHVLFEIPGALLWVSLTILSIFVVLEKSGEKASWLDSWSAGALSLSDDYQKIPRGEALFDFGISTITLLWVLEFIKMPTVLDSNKVEIIDWSILLPDWFWVVLVAMLMFDLVFCIVRLSRHYWTKSLRLTTIGTNIIWLAILVFVLSNSQIIDATAHEAIVDANLIKVINLVLKSVLLGAIIIISWETITHIRRVFKIYEGQSKVLE